jgi:hypothetical protein
MLADIVQLRASQGVCGLVQNRAKLVNGFVDVQKETGEEIGCLLDDEFPTRIVSFTTNSRKDKTLWSASIAE